LGSSVGSSSGSLFGDRSIRTDSGSTHGSQSGNAGGSGNKPNNSNVKFPSDAELVMHLVCRFLDEQMPGDSGRVRSGIGGTAFSDKWFAGIDKMPGMLRVTWLI
jgi:hypothetical protein